MAGSYVTSFFQEACDRLMRTPSKHCNRSTNTKIISTMHLSFFYKQIRKHFSVAQVVKPAISQSTMCQLHIYLFILFIAGCKEKEIKVEELFFPGNCRVLSYEPRGEYSIPTQFQYNDLGVLNGIKSSLPLLPISKWEFDSQGRPLEWSGEILSAGSEIVPFFTYLYGEKGIESIEQFSYDFDINGQSKPTKTSRKIIRHIFEYGKSDKPESMELMYLEDSAGIEIKSRRAKRFEYQYDGNGNLAKELYLENEKGQMLLKNTKIHFYDSQANSLTQLHFVSFLTYYSSPFMFSKNNLVQTKIVVDPLHSYTEDYDLKYDGEGRVTADGKWFTKIKWECK